MENQSKYDLEYITFGTQTGYPVESVVKAFKKIDEDKYILPKGSVGVLTFRTNHGGVFGKWVADIVTLGINTAFPNAHVEGYLSVRVRSPGKNYIISCGFLTGRNRCNKMGIRISAEDGALDSRGNVAGHGVDATGNVANISELSQRVMISFSHF